MMSATVAALALRNPVPAHTFTACGSPARTDAARNGLVSQWISGYPNGASASCSPSDRSSLPPWHKSRRRVPRTDREKLRVLKSAAVIERNGLRLGVAGAKGFGGGFVGACGSDFGEPEMKAFVRHTKDVAAALEGALAGLHTDIRVALMHYAPVEQTLQGERPEIYPFLGSYLLGEAIDRAGATLVLHGDAHRGIEKGVTPGGIPVRNVALPVIRRPYNVYCLEDGDSVG